MPPGLAQITPFVLCSDLERQIAFYRDVLGFTLGFKADNYAFLRCDSVAVRLLEVNPDETPPIRDRENSFYIDVHGIDAVYQKMKPMLDGLAQERVRAPFDQPYGQREFHVHDEDGTLVFFGESSSEQ